MSGTKHSVKYRKDYTPYHYTISNVDLDFRLYEDKTRVIARISFIPNPYSKKIQDDLLLYGEELKLISIELNNIPLREDAYEISDTCIKLSNLPEQFELKIETEIDPDGNTSLEGLYRSSGNYCTQCEAEGFRKITYYLDRPDVMAKFTTRIEGDKSKCPVMLSNGNLIEEGEVSESRHYVIWQDPFPKPSYLFALVAGQLVCIEDSFETMSKRPVSLKIYVEERNKEKCGHAMESLKKSMRWDEEVFGLAYDLDTYMIVAVDDFNMGAMENKGLNIFNSKYVLASVDTATDQDYLGIEGVIAHEYFHNWTGNRVTCRDWFQLSLKEGLTVFRDQEFSSDMNSRSVQRIDDVKILRDYQFREDSGPMAHSVRPDSYVEINNFYTVTVYNKGAEVIRMIHTLLGADNFRRGMDLYFKRHDGQAVTCDDFVAAMADSSEIDLSQFKLWYSQAGTPEIQVVENYDPENKQYSVTLKQDCPSTPGQETKEPFHMPLSIGLLDSAGREMELNDECVSDGSIIELHKKEQVFNFTNIPEKPVLSFNRGFSAPVKIKNFQSKKDLAFLMARDKDLFNRWEAANVLATNHILDNIELIKQGTTPQIDELYLNGIAENLTDLSADKSLLAQAVSLPSEMYIVQQVAVVDPDLIHDSRNNIMKNIAVSLKETLLETYKNNAEDGEYKIDNESIGRRRLKNTCLSYLMSLDPLPEEILELCVDQFKNSRNMTDKIAALKELANVDHEDARRDALGSFYESWKNDPLVMDKWFILQATSKRKECLTDVVELMDNPCFSLDNPNKVRSLIGAFCSGNHVRFQDITGKGYAFLADQIIKLNAMNPQIAARLLTPLTSWKRYDETRQLLMKEQLKRISGVKDISPDVFEVVKKSL